MIVSGRFPKPSPQIGEVNPLPAAGPLDRLLWWIDETLDSIGSCYNREAKLCRERKREMIVNGRFPEHTLSFSNEDITKSFRPLSGDSVTLRLDCMTALDFWLEVTFDVKELEQALRAAKECEEGGDPEDISLS